MSNITAKENLNTEPRENLRIRADHFLRTEGGEFDKISPADVKKLVLELKMHQMQLEMQNEELQLAQESITQARDRYADLYDFAPVGYFTLDRQGRIVEVNLAGAQLLGAERSLLVNQPFSPWVAPDSLEACRTHYRKVFASEGRQTCEIKLQRREGPPFYAALESVAAPGEPGPVLHCRTAMSDVTPRKQAEIELKLKERLLDGASDSIFLRDLDGHFIYVNEAACRDRGYEKEELQGKDIWALIPPDYAATRETILQDLLTQGEMTFESVHVRKDGSSMPVEIHARVIDLEDRRLILSVARDITERKRAEAEVKLNEARLAGLLRISQLPPTSIHDLLDYTLEEAIALTGSQIGYLHFYDEATQQFTLSAWSRDAMPAGLVVDPQTIYRLAESGLWGEAVRQAGPVMVNDFQKPHILKEAFPPGHAKIDKFLTVPVFFQGQIVAVAAVANKPADYDAADVNQLTLMMEVVWKMVERQRAAEELHLAAAKWQTTFDAIGDAVALMDQEGNILQANQAMVDLVDKPFSEIIGSRCWEVVHGATGPIENCPMVRLRQSRQREESVLAVGEIWLKVTVDPILDQAGNLIGAVHLIADITQLKRAEAEVQHSLEKITKALNGTVLAVANTVEMRDPYTAGHQRRVAQLAAAIAQEMGFSPERVEGMRVLGCLHDIGKVAIPAEILSKPGRISPMEFKLIQDHPRVGYEIIKDIDFPFPLAEGILQHHERFNGSGYPQGISGPDIILEARILGVADVVEAMASHRPYRVSLGIDQALEEISRNRGILYDPEIVDICQKLFTERGFSFSA